MAGPLLACWPSLGCSSEHPPDAAQEQAVARLKACGLVTGGQLLLPHQGERAQCELRCLGQMPDCADVQAAFCQKNWDNAVDCLSACYSHMCTELTIPKDALCDGTIDCSDASDEQNCGDEGFIDCKGGESVHVSKWCDDHIDCTTQNDELLCDDVPRFTCKDGTTIPMQKECDGELDCAVLTGGPSYRLVYDGSDELHCPEAAWFSCGDGSYIKESQRCDAHNDCENGRDEPIDCAAITCPSLPQ